jgi:hypothetical protein
MGWFSTLTLFTPLIKKVDPWLRERGFNKLSVADRLGVHRLLFGVGPAGIFGKNDNGSGATPAADTSTTRDITVKGTTESVKLIYGEIETPGFLAFMGTSSDTTKLYFVIVVAHHQCQAITQFRIDGTRIYLNQWASGTTNLVSHPQFIGEDGNSKLKITVHLGTNSQAVDADLFADCPQWDSTHVGKGVCYYVVQCTFDKKAWASGAPQNFFALVKGRRLYDPRLDSTNGGSGSHRYTDATTWAWSNNPALVLRDYMTGGSICYDVATPNTLLTLGDVNSRIDDAYVIAAANHCEESCTIPIPVLAGRLNWTNGSTAITGTDTNFTQVLANGNKLLGPDNNFYTISSITSDTALTLTANYTGTTTANAVTQWNTSSVTTTTQNRFTCDTLITDGQSHRPNIQIICSSMLGPIPPYVGGKFRILAGVYDSPTVTLNADDVLGDMVVTTHPNAEDLYNLVQGTFFDEDKTWQESPFPAITQASYQSDDNGLAIKTISLPATRTNFRCQRMANVILNQGRNQTSVSFTRLSQKAMLIAEWETFYMNLSELGWVNQVLRCTKFSKLADGFIAIEAQVEGSSAYSDLASTDYQLPRNINSLAQTLLKPLTPTGLTVISQPGGIAFIVSGTFYSGTTLELWEHTSSSPFSSAVKIAEGEQTVFSIGKMDTTTRYYWVRSKLNGQVSSTFPASTGSAGTAGISSFVPVGLAQIAGQTAMKVGGSSAKDSGFYSLNGYDVCHITWKANTPPTSGGGVNSDTIIGLTTSPATAAVYGSINYALEFFDIATSKLVTVLESGIPVGSSVPWTTKSVFAVTYDHSDIRYYLDSVLLHTTHAPGLTLYAGGSFQEPNEGVNSLRFGSSTNLALIDNTQLNDGSVTPGPNSSSPADGSISYTSGTQPRAESAGINGFVSVTPDIATGSSKVDVAWTAQARVDVTTSGTVVGEAFIFVTVQVNGSTVFTRKASIEPTAGTGTYLTFSGATNVTVPAGQTVAAFLTCGRTFSGSGLSPAQVQDWREAHLAAQVALR